MDSDVLTWRDVGKSVHSTAVEKEEKGLMMKTERDPAVEKDVKEVLVSS